MKVYQILISSPADLAPERKIAIETINALTHFSQISYGIELKPVTWEENSYPAFGADPQDVLNEQLPIRQDIYLGMLWKRIGTPTKRSLSGTVEEFDNAFKWFTRDPLSTKILLYFKKIPEALLDGAEERKVGFFKETLQAQGYYTWKEFLDENEFRSFLPIHLYHAVHDLQKTRKAQNWVEEDDGFVSLMKSTSTMAELAYGRIIEALAKAKEKGEDFSKIYSERYEILKSSTGLQYSNMATFNNQISDVRSKLDIIEPVLNEKLLELTNAYLDYIIAWVKFLMLIDSEDAILDKDAKLSAINEIDTSLEFIMKFNYRFQKDMKTAHENITALGAIKASRRYEELGFNFEALEKIIQSEKILADKLFYHFSTWDSATKMIKEVFIAIPAE